MRVSIGDHFSNVPHVLPMPLTLRPRPRPIHYIVRHSVHDFFFVVVVVVDVFVVVCHGSEVLRGGSSIYFLAWFTIVFDFFSCLFLWNSQIFSSYAST